MTTIAKHSNSSSKKSAVKAARKYAQRGWSPIRVPYRKKAPKLSGWPDLRIREEDVDEHFGGRRLNVGVLLGPPSNGLVDVDLDDDVAVQQAPFFLPKTDAIFGRKSRLRSHYLYYAPGAKSRRFTCANGTLLEMRSTGAQTLFPGSTHPSGERVKWHKNGAPILRSRRSDRCSPQHP